MEKLKITFQYLTNIHKKISFSHFTFQYDTQLIAIIINSISVRIINISRIMHKIHCNKMNNLIYGSVIYKKRRNYKHVIER